MLLLRTQPTRAFLFFAICGAANELTSALIVNPYDRDEVAAALDRALTMSLAERISRHAEMLDVIVKKILTTGRIASLAT